MIVDLAEMKAYLGETSTDYDVFLTQQLMVVNNAIENYCGRKFDLKSYTQTYYRDDTNQVRVPDLYTYHYPVTAVSLIEDENGDAYTDYRVSNNKGKLTSQCNFRKDYWFNGCAKLEVTYSAGYLTADMPPELKQAVYSIVAEGYNKKKAGIDVGFGNNVQRISVAGVMSLDFDYTLESNQRSSAFGMILGDWANVIDFYRSERTVVGTDIWENYES